MKNKIQGYDIHAAKQLAIFYFEIGRNIWHEVNSITVRANQNLVYKSIVGYVNSAFSCEIMLKVIGFSSGMDFEKLTNTHNIKNLYDCLSDDQRRVIRLITITNINNIIENQPVYTEADFERDMDDCKDAFVVARYWFEIPAEGNQGKQAQQLFIYSLSGALKQFI